MAIPIEVVVLILATAPFWFPALLSIFICFHAEWKHEPQGFDRADKHTCKRCGIVRFWKSRGAPNGGF